MLFPIRTIRTLGVTVFPIVAAASGPIEPFTEEAISRGVVYSMQDWPQIYGHFGFGCGFADLDNDGDADIVIIGAADERVGVFENDGTGHYIDRSSNNGIPLLPEGSGFVAADYDGDGDLDLYLTQIGLANVLVRNDGQFQFTDVSQTAGVDETGASESACFGDFDNDGWLDLYVANYRNIVPGESRNVLYHNLGNGTFEDVSAQQTVDNEGYGFQAVWFDYDRNGAIDLYLSNDKGQNDPYHPNQLWHNDGGQLVNVSEASGSNVALYSMGVACGDLDGNGWPDLYCTNIPGGGRMDNPLLLNQGDGTFVESSVQWGVSNPFTSWGAIFCDFDNNTHQDLYVNNMSLPNTLYLNDGEPPCAEMSAALEVTANAGISFSSAVADVDNDGDLDLLVNNLGHNVELFINHEGETRNWVKYRLIGQGNNVFAVGGNVDTRVGEDWQFREVLAGGNGYLGQNDLTLHVGLDAAVLADEVVIDWPGGSATRTLTDLPVNQTWSLYPPDRLGDADGDGTVDMYDFSAFDDCYTAAFEPGCEMMDFNGNSSIDCDDWSQFLLAWSGGEPPNMPDCECPGDIGGDGIVDAVDLASLLGSWGPCFNCEADLNYDGVVDATDLALLLGAWGPCP